MLTALLTALMLAQPAGWQASSEVFGEPARVEVRGLEAAPAETALRAAVAELAATEAETAALAVRLNAAAGLDPMPVAQPAREMLRRALGFCLWSEGAHGPTGGVLYELWRHALPSPAALAAARQTAGCDRLRLDDEAGTAQLAAGSRLDLRGFAAGWAVDRAIDVLREHGVGNARVRLGGIERAIGPGPAGRGWAIDPDLPREWLEPLPAARLRDRALAVAGNEPELEIAGDRYAAHLNLRSGRPAEGVVATLALSELAIDAQALAITMFVLGQREGMMRLGSLRPEPAVAWLLGRRDGSPLLTTHRWAVQE